MAAEQTWGWPSATGRPPTTELTSTYAAAATTVSVDEQKALAERVTRLSTALRESVEDMHRANADADRVLVHNINATRAHAHLTRRLVWAALALGAVDLLALVVTR